MASAASTIILVLAALVAEFEGSPGRVRFELSYLRPGVERGSIEVKGHVTLNKGWRVVGKTVIVNIFINGGEVRAYEVPIKDRTFGPAAIVGLQSEQLYAGSVYVTITDGQQTETLAFIIQDTSAT